MATHFAPGPNARIHGYPQSLAERDPGQYSLLRVDVIAGLNLAKKDIFGLSDPYCLVKLIENSRENVIEQTQTIIKKKTLNPKWNKTFIFRVKKQESKLIFEIYDENRLTRDDYLGEVEIGLADIPTETESVQVPYKEYLLQGRSRRSRVRGHLRLKLCYFPSAEEESQSNERESDDFITVSTSTNERIEEPEWETVSVSDAPIRPNHAPSRQLSRPENDEPLPTNWEERQDANGRLFYINHNTRETTWIRPRATQQNNPEQQMDYARRLERNFSLRRHFSIENDTQARLSAERSPPEATTENIPGQVIEENESVQDRPEQNNEERQRELERRLERNFSLRRHANVEHSTQARPSEGGSTPEDITDNVPSPLIEEDERTPSPLPVGWEERMDDNGRTFYIDHNNRTTSWVRPRNTSVVNTNEDAAANAPPVEEPAPEENAQAEPQPSGERLHPDIPSVDEIPLLPGWAMQRAANGRVFFIDHNNRTTTWIDPRINYKSSAKDLGALPPGWEERVHQDGRVFFIDHNTQSTQWEDPRMQKIHAQKSQAVPYSRDYKRKYDFFRSRLRKPENVPNKFEIHVRRTSILEDSYRAILPNVSNIELLKTKLWIVFDGEAGLDYGGVSREWFYLLSREIFNPYYGLFEYSATDNYTLQINPNSGLCNDEHLNYFKFIGRVAGMAVYHGRLLDAFFIRPFYKMMLGKKIALTDMESVDSEYHNSLKWLQDNDPEILDLRFQVEEEAFGKISSRELKENGAEIKVTNKNKGEYIDLVIKRRFVDCVNDQMEKFKEGFADIVPHDLLRIFDERELEYLLCGLGEIDENDWRKHTNYRSGYNDKHVVIQWFWKAVGTFDNEMRARLLQFVTGTSRVPMNGFGELYGSNGPQKFTIERYGGTHTLPRAHTCFNRLDLPPYTSYHELREKLRLAIENTEGFEGVD